MVLRIYHSKDPRQKSSVYLDADWVGDYFKEFQASFEAEYESYTGYRRKPNFKGKYININSRSLRKTINACAVEGSLKIFVFGGSAVWGTGARDGGTLPSQLSHYLCDQGMSVTVTNFGESGYTSTQELIRLLRQLQQGNIPDKVVFYDGVNDVFSAYQNQAAGLPENLQHRQKEFNLRHHVNLWGMINNLNFIVTELKRKYRERNSVRLLSKETLQEALNIYHQNIRLARALGKEYGFQVYAYWQPTVFSKTHLSEEEKALAQSEAMERIFQQASGQVQTENLSHIFADEKEALFMDRFHLSESGNQIIAHEIGKDIRKMHR